MAKYSQKGLSLYLVIVIMTILLAVVLGLSAILLRQLKTVKGMEDSVIAFYAADTGIEKVLLDRGEPTGHDGESGTLANGAEYKIEVYSGINCGASNYCIKSVGIYKRTRRAIEVSY